MQSVQIAESGALRKTSRHIHVCDDDDPDRMTILSCFLRLFSTCMRNPVHAPSIVRDSHLYPSSRTLDSPRISAAIRSLSLPPRLRQSRISICERSTRSRTFIRPSLPFFSSTSRNDLSTYALARLLIFMYIRPVVLLFYVYVVTETSSHPPLVTVSF